MRQDKKTNSVAGKYVSDYPHLVTEWDIEKNFPLSVQTMKAGSSAKVWWNCSECQYSWKSLVYNRASRSGCPKCAGRFVDKANSLMTLNPTVASEWDYEKNGDSTPNNITVGSSRKMHWKCKKGHAWEARVASRSKGYGCPVCAKCFVTEINSLRVLKPETAKDWDCDRNGELTPDSVTTGSHKKVYWKCSKCNHLWKAPIYSRASGVGCPKCANRYIDDTNSLMALNPKMAADWDYEKNGEITPHSVSCSCAKKVYWKCHQGHSWSATVNSRSRGLGCPFCVGRYVDNTNCLSSLNPDLASEWDYEKNEGLTPRNVTVKGAKNVYWKCNVCHYSWKATIYNRSNGTGCPSCNISKGESQIAFFLTKQAIPYSHEHRIYNCKNKRKLPFDFIVGNESEYFLIEYQGEHHYSPTNFAGKSQSLSQTEVRFQKVLLRDEIKKQYCENNDIPLLVIPYTQLENIESILEDALKAYLPSLVPCK